MEGIARYIHETTKRMVLDNPEVEFHFIFDRPYDEKFIYAENVTPHVLSPPSRHPLLWYIWFEWSLPRVLKKINPDVFYSGDMFMSLQSDIPTIMVSHDLNYEHQPEYVPWSARKFMLHYSKKYHHKAKHLIAVSEATKNDIIELYGIDPANITVAGNAAPEGFDPLTNSEKQAVRDRYTMGLPYFIYVGSLHPRKNVKNLIVAFEEFKTKTGSSTKLVIYGRIAWGTKEIFDTHEKLVNKNDIIFIEGKNADVKKMTGAALASCYVSLFEGFGIPILEAFHAGIPVITSDCSSMPEVAGDAALLVDPRDPRSIAQAMEQVEKEPELRQKLVLRGHQRQTNFSWDRSSKTIFSCLKDHIG